MNFNSHKNLEGQHAFLSASNYSWINYSEGMDLLANFIVLVLSPGVLPAQLFIGLSDFFFTLLLHMYSVF